MRSVASLAMVWQLLACAALPELACTRLMESACAALAELARITFSTPTCTTLPPLAALACEPLTPNDDVRRWTWRW